MKIAISTDNGFVSDHFGRCPSFTIIDMIDGKLVHQEILDNPGHQPGYIPAFLKARDVQCVVAGGMGARALGIFQDYNIQTIVGVRGHVAAVIQQLEAGTLQSGESLCKPGRGKGYGLDKNECDHAHGAVSEHEEDPF